MPETSTTEWLKAHAPEGARIGYDPWLHTRDWVNKAKEALASRGAELVAVARNPIDEVWRDRPEASKARLVVQPDQFAGKSAAVKSTAVIDSDTGNVPTGQPANAAADLFYHDLGATACVKSAIFGGLPCATATLGGATISATSVVKGYK